MITTMSPDARVVIDPLLQLGTGGLLSGNVSGTTKYLHLNSDMLNITGGLDIRPSNATMDIMNLYQNSGNKVMGISSSGYVGIGTNPSTTSLMSLKNLNSQHTPLSVFNSTNNLVASINNDGMMRAQQIQVGDSDAVKCFASGKVSTDSVAPASTKDFVVTFTKTLAEPPTVMLTKEDVTNGQLLDVTVKSQSISSTGFTISVRNTSATVAASVAIHWFAVCTA